MPAASNPLTQTWIPREAGKGGHYTNATYHDQVPDSTWYLTGLRVKNNAWMPLPGYSNYGSAQSGDITTLDIFNRYTGTSQALTSSVIAGITDDGASKSKVVNMTTNAVIRSSASAQPTTGTGRYVFASVKNRLYMANGTDVPAISPDATASSCIPWGKSPQSQNLMYQIAAPGTGNNAYVVGGTQGTCTVTNSGTTNNVAWVSGPNFQYFKTGQPIYINGVWATIATVPTNTTMTLLNNGTPVVANGVGVPFSYAPTGLSTGGGSVTVTGAGGVQATGTVTTLTTLTWNTGVKFDVLTVGSTIYLDGVANTVASITSATVLTLGSNSTNAVHNLSYGTVAGGSNVYGSTALTAWTGFGVGAPSLDPLSTAPWLPPGSPIFISTGAGALPVTPTVQYAITPGSASAGTLATTYAEATGGSAVTRSAQVNFGPISFQNSSYTYAVSYWNFTSGHITNPSAVASVKDGAPNNVNVTVTISNIIATNDSAYNYIILWRSQAGNASLQPLAILNNDNGNVGNGTITYTDTLGDDTALGTCLAPGQSTGPGKIIAPTGGTNAPPPSDLNLIAYWDGRFWGASQTQIGLLFFSARSTFGAVTSLGANEDINCGVAEECWPPIFTRAIPDSDGRITGLRVVGGTLMVLTDNSIYAVFGSNQTGYGLSKVSSKGKGTSHFATCVIPGEDVNATDVLVHFGNDGRLYFLFGSGGDFPISYPIQGELDSLGATASSCTLGVMHTPVSTYILLTAVPGGNRYFYDLERKIWLKTTVTQFGTGYCEGLVGGVMSQYVSDYNFGHHVYQENKFGGATASYSIQTNHTTFGTDRKDDKMLESVTVYTNEPVIGLNVNCYVEIDNSGSALPMGLVPSTGTYGPAYHEAGDALVFIPNQTIIGGPCRGRVFSFIFAVNQAASFNSAVYEITAKASYTQEPAKLKGTL